MILWGALVIACGAVVQGICGFGFAIVTVPPLLLLHYSPKLVVAIGVILGIVNAAYMVIKIRKHLVASIIAPLAVGAMFGIPVGMVVLANLDGPVFKALVGGFMMLFAAVLLSGWQRPVKNTRRASYPIGFASGLLNASISMAGPPVILFLANQSVPKDVFRANIVMYFLLVNLGAFVAFGYQGWLTVEVWRHAAFFVPVMLCFTTVGIGIADKVSERVFRRLALLSATIMGAVLLIKNLVDVIYPGTA